MYVYGYSCRYEEDEKENLRGKVNRNWKIYIKGTLNALSSTTYTFRIFMLVLLNVRRNFFFIFMP